MVYNCLSISHLLTTGRRLVADLSPIFIEKHCLLCQARLRRDTAFCNECEDLLPYTQSVCVTCAAQLPADNINPAVCGRCLRQRPAFDQTLALYSYSPPIVQLIVAMKFHQKLHIARALGTRLADRLQQITLTKPPRKPIDLIMPIPLHNHRLRSRGYNQALELARPIARRLQIPVDPYLLKRTRATAPQTTLSPKHRRDNVRNAFAISSKAKEFIKGKHIALIDDVMTTGHTVNAAAGCLKKAGVNRVEIWVIARA